jgi:hypothetical protein
MITLYGFGRIHPGMIGEGRDLRAQWALEETGLPYRFNALDYIAGELDGPAYSRLSYFHQVPVIDTMTASSSASSARCCSTSPRRRASLASAPNGRALPLRTSVEDSHRRLTIHSSRRH